MWALSSGGTDGFLGGCEDAPTTCEQVSLGQVFSYFLFGVGGLLALLSIFPGRASVRARRDRRRRILELEGRTPRPEVGVGLGALQLRQRF